MAPVNRRPGAITVLHAFQKKSHRDQDAQHDVDLVARRLKTAQQDYEARHGEAKH
jgi:phage-related protein